MVACAQPAIVPQETRVELRAIARHHWRFQPAQRELQTVEGELDRGGPEVAGGEWQQRSPQQVRELHSSAFVAHPYLSISDYVEPHVERAGELAQLVARQLIVVFVNVQWRRIGRGLWC